MGRPFDLKTTNSYDGKVRKTDHFFLAFISIAFVLSDWIISYFSFSELFLGPLLILLLIFGRLKIHRHQVKWALIPIGYVLLNTLMQLITNQQFDIQLAVISTIKLIFYISVIIIMFNYIREYTLEKALLIWINIVAMIICIIAVYIAIAIYLEGAIPWRFFVTFTRTGGNVFRTDPLIVRAKSIFMEPAHLGYYLNTVLAVNLLNNVKVKIPVVFTLIIMMIVVLTFSYSAIGVMLFILLLYGIKMVKRESFQINKKVLLMAVIAGIAFTFIFWESINITLIDRTVRLFRGDESSGYERLILSWQYVKRDNFFIGNGILHTPPIWNNLAYIQSDFGIVGSLLMIIMISIISTNNLFLGLTFVLMNFVKGGYLAPAYWFLILVVLLYSTVSEKPLIKGWFGKEDKRVKK